MKIRRFFIGLFIVSVLICIGYSLQYFEHLHITIHAIIPFALLVTVSVILQMLGHILRAYKSRYLLDHIRESSTATLFQGLSVGYLFNSLLPFRLGEFIRAFYVGDALAISKTTVFISILVERVVDGIILGLSLISAGLLLRSSSSHGFFTPISRLGLGLLLGTSAIGLVVYIIRSEDKWFLRAIHNFSHMFNERLSSRIRFTAWSAIYGTRLMLSSRRTLFKYVVASLIMWFLYLSSAALIVIAFFSNISIAQTWYATVSSFAGSGTPIGPGYVGTFYLIVVHLLHAIGITSSAGFAIVVWLVLTVPISIVGLFVLIRQQLNQTRTISQQEALINKLYREKDVSNELSNFLNAYFKGEEINRVLTQAELDGTFKLVRSFKGGSKAHTMLVWQDKKLVVKKITLPEYADKLKDQEHWLRVRGQSPHLPKVVGKAETSSYYMFDIEYKADYVPFFDYIHSHATTDSFRIVKGLLRFMDKYIYSTVSDPNGTEDLRKYIDSKVLGKVNDTASVSHDISELSLQPKIVVNGVRYDNIFQIVQKIRRNKKAMSELADYMESPIHGDLTIDNIIASPKGDFLVLDPNNENQVSSPVVDYGKLYQSLHSGYEFLIQLEHCEVTESTINFEDSKSQKYGELFAHIDDKLRKDLEPEVYRTILFHEAVHYCRMLTYRATINPATLPVFYATAVKLFNEFLEQYA